MTLWVNMAKGLEPGVVYHWQSIQILSWSHRFYLQTAFFICLCFSIFTNFSPSKPPSPLAWATNQFPTGFPISTLALMAHPAHQSSLQNVDQNCVPPCLKPSDGVPLLVSEVSQVQNDLALPTSLISPGAILFLWNIVKIDISSAKMNVRVKRGLYYLYLE